QEGLYEEDLRVRMLRAQGRDEEADALELAIKHERELAQAQEIGYSAETIAYLKSVQAQEKLAQARKDELDAINAVTTALNNPQGLNLALLTYRAGLTGGLVGRREPIDWGPPVETRPGDRPDRRGGDTHLHFAPGAIVVDGAGDPRTVARTVWTE